MSSCRPCQCVRFKSTENDNALFLSDKLSDLTITFPSHNIYFPAHRLMMAKTSQYFENLFYGPMAIKGQEWVVKDNDIDPEIFKIMLAHCYSLNLMEESIEIILPVYKLADCYLIDSLKSECLGYVSNIISNDTSCSILDYPYIFEWSKNYGFIDFEVEALKSLSINCNRRYISINVPNLLLNLPLDTCKELLNLCRKNIDKLTFKESWRNPAMPLSSELLMSIFESSACKDELSVLQGCFSPELVSRLLIKEDFSQLTNKIVITFGLYLSLIDILHSQALYKCVKDFDLISNDLLLYLHIKCNSMSPTDLAVWSSSEDTWVYILYLSDLDDKHVQWAVETINYIKPVGISLPRSSLSMNGLNTILTWLKSFQVKLQEIDICSCNIKSKDQKELDALVIINYGECNINIYELDDEIYGW